MLVVFTRHEAMLMLRPLIRFFLVRAARNYKSYELRKLQNALILIFSIFRKDFGEMLGLNFFLPRRNATHIIGTHEKRTYCSHNLHPVRDNVSQMINNQVIGLGLDPLDSHLCGCKNYRPVARRQPHLWTGGRTRPIQT